MSMTQTSDWIRVAHVSDLREGEGFDTGVEVAGEVVGLFAVDGKYYALGECTHEKGPICQGHREGLEVSCPWHSAKFNIATGECLRGPVACRTDGSVVSGEMCEAERTAPLPCFDVKVEGDDVFVRPPNAASTRAHAARVAD
jgi:nitrite reductase/ring-hydroxylating ferredoxin subunit